MVEKTYQKLTEGQKSCEATFSFSGEPEKKFKSPELKSVAEFNKAYADRQSDLMAGKAIPFHLSYSETANGVEYFYRAVGRVEVEKDKDGKPTGKFQIICGSGIMVWDGDFYSLISRYSEKTLNDLAKKSAFTDFDDSLTRKSTGKAKEKEAKVIDATKRQSAIAAIQAMLPLGLDPLPVASGILDGDKAGAENLIALVKETLAKAQAEKK